MHILKKSVITLSALAGIGMVAGGIYFFPVVATLAFLGCVIMIWFIRIKQGENKRAWIELAKSLFLDW
jgi:hypothetical protein